jgi:hypothetical protein
MPSKYMNEFCLKNDCRDSDGNLQQGGDRKAAGHKLILSLPHNDGRSTRALSDGREEMSLAYKHTKHEDEEE